MDAIRKYYLVVPLLLILAGNNLFCRDTLTLAYSLEVRNDPSLAQYNELISQLFHKIGYNVEFVYLPSERALISANSGLVDGIPQRVGGLSQKYESLIQSRRPLWNHNFVCFSSDPEIRMRSWEDLLSLSEETVIVRLRGIKRVQSKIEEFASHCDVYTLDSRSAAFSFLASGRGNFYFDISLENPESEEFEKAIPQGVYFSGILESTPHYTYLNKKHEALIPLLEQAIDEMMPTP